MKTSKTNFRFVAAASAGVALLGFISACTQADVVFNTLTGTQYIDQQTGNNFYYLGDGATIAPTSEPLTTIEIPFGTSALAGQGPFTYTPDLVLGLYPNANDALTQTALIGSAEVNNVIFANDGVVDPSVGYNYEDEQVVTFDFTSQAIILPTTFVFAYHDNASLDSNGDVYGANGLSVGLTALPATVGTSDQATFDTYPNSSPSETLDYTWDAGLNIEAQINTVPEPASFSLLGIGALALLRRRHRA